MASPGFAHSQCKAGELEFLEKERAHTYGWWYQWCFSTCWAKVQKQKTRRLHLQAFPRPLTYLSTEHRVSITSLQHWTLDRRILTPLRRHRYSIHVQNGKGCIWHHWSQKARCTTATAYNQMKRPAKNTGQRSGKELYRAPIRRCVRKRGKNLILYESGVSPQSTILDCLWRRECSYITVSFTVSFTDCGHKKRSVTAVIFTEWDVRSRNRWKPNWFIIQMLPLFIKLSP